MAVQAFVLRASTLITNNCRVMLNSRTPQLTQLHFLRTKSDNKLKDLLSEKPKKPLSPYFKFCHEHRQSVMQQHPDWKVTQVVSQCALDWKEANEEIKDKYKEEYEKQLAQYKAESAKYEASLTEEQKQEIKDHKTEIKKDKKKRVLKKKLRDEHKPKRPPAAYALFILEQSKLQNKSYGELLSSMKGNWAAMEETEKSKYQSAAALLKAKHEEELEKWEMKMLEEGKSDLVRKKVLDKKSEGSKKQTKPESHISETKFITKKRSSKKTTKTTEDEQ